MEAKVQVSAYLIVYFKRKIMKFLSSQPFKENEKHVKLGQGNRAILKEYYPFSFFLKQTLSCISVYGP